MPPFTQRFIDVIALVGLITAVSGFAALAFLLIVAVMA
jgi:hypothetical protein